MRRPVVILAFSASLAAAHAHSEEVLVGAPTALTGVYAFVGVPIANGMRLAVDEVNASGRLGADRTLKLVIEDYASEKRQAISLISRFVHSDGAVMILGPNSTEDALAAVPVANELATPIVTNAVMSKVRESSRWAFNVPSPTDVSIRALCDYVVDRYEPKTFAGVATRNNAGAVNELKAARECMTARGVELLADDTVLGSDLDYTVLATKLAALDPDILIVTGTDRLAANLKQQIIQAGGSPEVRIMGSNALAAQSFLDLGGPAVDGSILVADYFVGSDGEPNRKFVESYTARFDEEPGNWAAIGYTMVEIAAHAIANAGEHADSEALLKELTALSDMPTVLGSGRYSFADGRVPDYGSVFLIVDDGKFVPVQQE